MGTNEGEPVILGKKHFTGFRGSSFFLLTGPRGGTSYLVQDCDEPEVWVLKSKTGETLSSWRLEGETFKSV